MDLNASPPSPGLRAAAADDARPPRRRRRGLLGLPVVAVTALAVVAVVAVVGWRLLPRPFGRPAPGTAAVAGGEFVTVVPTDLDVTVVKDGEIQAVENIDVQSHVEGKTTIVSIAKEGSFAHKGDVLVELDSALLREKLLEAKLARRQAESDLQSAKDLLTIQEAQNAADLQAAQVALELAQIALEQFRDGTYPQQLATAQTAVETAEVTARGKREELDRTRTLYAKGFVTATDVKNAQLALGTAENDAREAQTALRVLTDYTRRMEMATRDNAVSQARQTLARVRTTNASLLATARSTAETKELALATKTAAQDKLEQQIAYCTIRAPADGTVVYVYDDDDDRVAEGAEVRERQRLIRLPDTSRMKAVVKMGESQVARLRRGQRALVRLTSRADLIPATLTQISPVAATNSRWSNPDLREYPVEVVLDRTPTGLQPGMRAEVRVFSDRLDDVLAVPMAAVYADRAGAYVFVRDGAGGGGDGEDGRVVPTRVTLAQASDTHVCVAQGLAAGQSVLLLEPGEGRDLLARAGLATADPAPAPNAPDLREAADESAAAADQADGKDNDKGKDEGGGKKKGHKDGSKGSKKSKQPKEPKDPSAHPDAAKGSVAEAGQS